MACFADINVSQGSAATYARCGGVLISISLQIYQEIFWWFFFKSVNIWQNYDRESMAPLFGPLCRSIESCGHWQRLIFVWLVKNSLLHGHVQWCVVAYLSQEPELAIQYDTMRDTVLTCAQKPTLLSVNYRTEPKTKMRKTEKLKK